LNIRRMVKLAQTMPPGALLGKAAARLARPATAAYGRWRDARHATYLPPLDAPRPLLRYFKPLAPSDLAPYADPLAGLADNYLHHRFDLLGSGWQVVRHGMACPGVEGHRYDSGPPVQADPDGAWLRGRINPANLSEAQRIWRLVDPGYVPIDWRLDFKSGYRWREDTWYRDIRFGRLPGVDVKVPWELARGQHLPMLAWAYALAAQGDDRFTPPDRYLREFRNQVLDFVAANPPRCSANGVTAMDVAIRAANWLACFDLFRAYGAAFDAGFEAEFQRSIMQHGEHIIANLEWSPDWRGNHYLANIAGLVFIAAYLPPSPRVNTWLAFALQELACEILAQFHPDGSSVEASTSYHRLSAEMVVYAVALGLGLPAEKVESLRAYDRTLYRLPRPLPADGAALRLPWSEEHLARIARVAAFTLHITKPSGEVPQIGDNDSGRFLKLIPALRPMTVPEACARYANLDGYEAPAGMTTYWDEQVLDHRHLVAASNGLLDRADFAEFASTPETAIVRGLAGGSPQPGGAQQARRALRTPGYIKSSTEVDGAGGVRVGLDWAHVGEMVRSQRRVVRQTLMASGGGLRDGLRTFAYPDFGLYVFRSERLYLAVRCGSIGQRGSGGHAHNDQLAIELMVDGQDRFVDPGTYLYTPLPERRQQYRSVRAHYAPQPASGEPGRLDLGLFLLGDEARAERLYFGLEGFAGMHRGYGAPVYRLIAVEDDRIVIEDAADEVALIPLPETGWPPAERSAVSPKYGARLR
jgi:hypothetical protein